MTIFEAFDPVVAAKAPDTGLGQPSAKLGSDLEVYSILVAGMSLAFVA